jgi:hypothetical protein
MTPVAAFRRAALAALAAFPEVRRRFEAGLPPRHTFFVTTWLRDGDGRQEHVFVAVDSVSEEGNEVGKFMDTYRPPASCPGGGSPSA